MPESTIRINIEDDSATQSAEKTSAATFDLATEMKMLREALSNAQKLGADYSNKSSASSNSSRSSGNTPDPREAARKRLERERFTDEMDKAYASMKTGPNNREIAAAGKKAEQERKKAADKKRRDDAKAARDEERARNKKLRDQANDDRKAIRMKKKADADKAKVEKQADKERKQKEKEKADAKRKQEQSWKDKLDAKIRERQNTKSQAEGNVSGMIPGFGAAKESTNLISGGALKMGGLAAAGAILPLVAMGADQVAKSFQRVTSAVNSFGDAVAKGVGNEREGLESAVGSMRQGGIDTLKSIPIVGDMLAAPAELTKAVMELPDKITASFITNAQKLAPYSGAITGAQANGDIRKMMADIREANTMGEDYARLIGAQNDLDNTVRELLMPIKKFVLEILADRMEMLNTAAQVVINAPAIMKELLEGIDRIATAKMLNMQEEKKRAEDNMWKGIRDIIDRALNKHKNEDMWDEFFKATNNVKLNPNAFRG